MIKFKGFLVVAFFGAVFLLTPTVAQAEGYCFCGTDPKLLSGANRDQVDSSCASLPNESQCTQMQSDSEGKLTCEFFTNDVDQGKTACADRKKMYDTDLEKTKEVAGSLTATSSKLIPECLLKDELSAECRDVSTFVYFGLAIANYLFTIIGALALIMFVYGGFTLILSQGSPDKVKKGGEIIVAAVIGLVVVFGAYMLVSFLGEAVGIKSGFQLK